MLCVSLKSAKLPVNSATPCCSLRGVFVFGAKKDPHFIIVPPSVILLLTLSENEKIIVFYFFISALIIFA